MSYGNAGRILRVNLSDGSSNAVPLPEDLRRDYLGGRGFVAKILYDELSPDVDPLSPANIIVIASGILSGVFLPASGKIEMGAKSPATGGYGDSNMGGHLATELKLAGYDAIVIEGRAPSPSYLVVDDDRVKVEDASDLWGKRSFDVEKGLKDRLGEDFQIATIGPAGENLVKFACVSHDFGRQAGRTGIGAVWGSKNLKALAVRGTKAIPLKDPRAVFEKGAEMYRACFAKPGFKQWTPEGTAGVTDWVNKVGVFPTRNFQSGYFDKYESINGKSLRDNIWVLDKGCFGCPTPCGKYSRAELKGEAFNVEGPEYETIALLGGNVELGRIEEVAYVNYIADQLGIDTISGGAVVGFAIECFERGIITEKDVGRRLAFGDVDSVAYLLERIAAREGIGDVLAEGVRSAAQRFGKGAGDFAPHVKGLELSGYESRHAPAMMLSYMTADIGAHHNRSWAVTYDVAAGRDKMEGKAEKVIELQHIRPLFDVLGLCRLQWVELEFELERYAEIFPLATGLDYSWDDLLKVSERVWNLTRAFNFKHIPDFGRSYDYPTKRFYTEPVASGPTKGKFMPKEKLDALLDDYYRLRGWDGNGRPTKEKLEELGLGFAAEHGAG